SLAGSAGFGPARGGRLRPAPEGLTNDPDGLDELDRRNFRTLTARRGGRPTGPETLAASLVTWEHFPDLALTRPVAQSFLCGLEPDA
ncbi:MAG: hypothetical protein OXG71_06510, partial [Rhodospirillales bacterium]|nr:hypothetical protein [Rhodospirillales bacterium]